VNLAVLQFFNQSTCQNFLINKEKIMRNIIIDSSKLIDRLRFNLLSRHNGGIQIMLLALIILTVSSSANAWDGERQGFLLGIGFGGGFDSYTGIQYDPVGPESEDNSTFAFAASPRIGYAINNRVAFYYSRHPLVFSVENEAKKDLTIFSCTEALLVHYYLANSSPSIYFGVGAGVGYFFENVTSNYSEDSLKGIGVIGTVGFEPIKHVSAELSLHYKSPQQDASDFGISLLVNVLGY
jgi:hypothetical protein